MAGGLGRWRVGRGRTVRRIAAVAVVCAAVATGCGQAAGVHERIAAAHAPGGAALASPSPCPSPTLLKSPPSPGSTAGIAGTGENGGSCYLAGYIPVVQITTVRTTARGQAAPIVHIGTAAAAPGPFRTCPVHGRGFYSDDFGAPRLTGIPHPHAGNDIFAALGTPVVAPFDGRAVATPNSLGGLSVTVYGAQGWVYNAHLVSYGKLGGVRAGDVVGLVGNSGDAAGGPTHDHFEWHPRVIPHPLHTSPFGYSIIPRSGAIDPFPYLNAVCR